MLQPRGMLSSDYSVIARARASHQSESGGMQRMKPLNTDTLTDRHQSK